MDQRFGDGVGQVIVVLRRPFVRSLKNQDTAAASHHLRVHSQRGVPVGEISKSCSPAQHRGHTQGARGTPGHTHFRARRHHATADLAASVRRAMSPVSCLRVRRRHVGHSLVLRYGSGFRVLGSRLGSRFRVRSKFLVHGFRFQVPGPSYRRRSNRACDEPGTRNQEPGTVEPPGEPGMNEEQGTQPGTQKPGTRNRPTK